MHVTPPLPLIKRVPPGAWTALAWCACTALTYLARVRLPGEWGPEAFPAFQLYRWDGLLFLALAAGTTLWASILLGRRPLAALWLLLLAAILVTGNLAVGGIPLLQSLPVDVALCFLTAVQPRRTGNIAAATALGMPAAYLVLRVLCGWPIALSAELVVVLCTVVAWLIGNSLRQSQEHARQLAERTAAQAVTAERLRIARELHDMVAHSIGIIALQAGAAGRVIETQPARARQALREVELTGRETLSGLRRMLGALRQAEPGREDGALGQSMPGLADVERLAEATTAAGVRVEVRWRGERRPLPPEIDLSAFRIVQESVTNVVRHAGSGSCRVSIDCRPEEVAIEVVDAGGRAQNGGGQGYGLTGMRERVALLHGEFTAAPRPGGGFRVAARLPVPAGVR
ncbi:sensor histidine kinase [Streptomyces orinoci]|uniref:histidine kinase n=1 Tax=Streptomyces orinoci TaxID=67339 RepID=A0ABV3K4W5_STRON|nr:histidine kinase [Streptomyces orinoci]